MTTVALDASALMAPVERDLRLFDELDRLLGAVDPAVPDAVVEELDRLAGSGGEEGRAARVGRDLAARCRTIDTNEQNGDDALVSLAEAGEAAYVVTADRGLRDRLLDAGASVIGPRGSATLAVTEP
ncbi:MAG: PIN domain-containing protein [Halobacteriales archaeon]